MRNNKNHSLPISKPPDDVTNVTNDNTLGPGPGHIVLDQRWKRIFRF